MHRGVRCLRRLKLMCYLFQVGLLRMERDSEVPHELKSVTAVFEIQNLHVRRY